MQLYQVKGMTCAACAASAQKVLSRTKGVTSVKVNFATHTAAVETDEPLTLEQLNEKLSRAGYEIVPKTKDAYKNRHQEQVEALQKLKKELIFGAAFAIPLFIIAMFLMHRFPNENYIMLGLTAPILFVSGRRFFVSAAKQLTVFKANMDTLVAMGTGTAFLFSLFNTFFPEVLREQGMQPHVYYETVGVLIVFILLGKYLEARASLQTSEAIEGLVSMQVPTVQLIDNGEEKTMPVEVVAVGDVIKIRPGETVPLDATVTEGIAQIDESMLTGEPLPVSKKNNDAIFGGTIVQSGSLLAVVSNVGEDTMLAQIIRLVEEAQSSQIPVQKMVDKVSAIFVPSVIGIAAVTFLVWLLFGNVQQGVVAAVAVLVVACPCALGLATPTAIMVGIGAAAKKGILIRNAAAIEHSATINTVVLDKTGTITEGKPQVAAVYWAEAIKTQQSRLSEILVALENESEHPIAQMIVADFEVKGFTVVHKVEKFENLTGLGLQGTIAEQVYYIGNQKLMEQRQIEIASDIRQTVQQYLSQAYTLAFFADNRQVFAIVALSDKVKEDSRIGIQSLLEDGMDVVMLTGDHEKSAAYISGQVGLHHFKANLMPQDKIAEVKRMQDEGKRVMMVGDGINDAPALAQANVGVAMNNGTSVAIGSADIVLQNNNLELLHQTILIAQKMVQIINQNLFWAFAYNVVALPVAALGWLNPMLAGAAMAFSSVSVVLNSLRLKRV